MAKGPTVSTVFNAIDKISKPMKRMTAGMKRFAAIGGAAVAAGLAITTREFIKFDESITAASAKFGDLNLATEEGQETLRRLGEAAREVGATTKFSASEAAQGLDFLAMAGFSAEQAITALPQVTNLATVAQTDLATATDIASDSLGAFGLMTDDATQLQENFTRVNDVMAKTMTSSNTNMADLFETVKAGAPTFTAAGQSLESFAALAGVMANSGVKGSTSGTSLRNVMLKLADPTSEAATVMEKLGVNTQDQEGNFRDIIDIIADFESGLEGMGTAQRTAALSTVFGARSVTGINVLLESGTEVLREYREEIEGASGASQEMADIIGDSLANKLKSLKSAGLEKGFQLIEQFANDASGGISGLTEKIRNLDIGPFVDKIVKGVAFLKEWGPQLLLIIAGIKGWAIAQTALNVAQTASPIGIFVASAAALLVLMDKIEKKFGFGQSIVDEFGGGIGSREFEEGRRERLRKRQEDKAMEDPRRARLLARNEAALQASGGISGSASIDVNINGAPPGSTSRQSGILRPIELTTGFGGGGL